jgi:hypothetical protein
MHTLSIICLIYTIIYWIYLFKIEESDIFNFKPTWGRIILIFTSVFSFIYIISICIYHLP